MDTTKQYIKYSERAKNVQKEAMKRFQGEMCMTINTLTGIGGFRELNRQFIYKDEVILLMQDQIQDLLRSEYPDSAENLQDVGMFQDLYKWMKKKWSIVQARFWTPEQKWFGFLMFKKYNKVWSIFNEGEWVDNQKGL